MPSKRSKVHAPFDPNQSDPEDEDFEVGETRERSSRKSTKRSKPPTKKSGAKKRRKRNEDSDISEDEESDAEESFSDDFIQSEPEIDENTGRPKRRAKAVSKNYVEMSDEEEVDEDEEKSEQEKKKKPSTKRKSHLIKLPVSLPTQTPASKRSTRAGSAARLVSSAPATRRATRATTVDEGELIELSSSGRHAVRASHTPEPQPYSGRTSRGAKSVKQPPPIEEATQESSTHDQAEEIELVQTDLADAQSVNDSHDGEDDEDAGADADADAEMDEDAAMQDNEPDMQADADDDEDEDPITIKGRTRSKAAAPVQEMEEDEPIIEAAKPTRRITRKAAKSKDDASDFEYEHDSDGDDMSGSASLGGGSDGDNSPIRGRSAKAGKTKSTRSSTRRRAQDESEDDGVSPEKEAAHELQDLGTRRQRRITPPSPGIRENRRTRRAVDYRVPALAELNPADEEVIEENYGTPSRAARRGDNIKWDRSWANTLGPFGGGTINPGIVGGPWAMGAVGGIDSDSSDDEGIHVPAASGALPGMTPTTAVGPGLLPPVGQPLNTDLVLGTPAANVGRVKSAKALADADPLGVDADVDFSKVGGLEGHINQLKEMVQMPLLYPDIFMKLHVTPPRGVLFHGPPGTGKTLLARALAASVSSGGKKVTFYMRKGADALSKWVGEAEKSLRLLFEEARRTQPSIIFFDEIDGLAPVRSSKQEQIHASIVSTLLALMDGMDGRGQVIVIGATNRPDNIDPALRRPGRFDREFYFPLPDTAGRLQIINIHTRDWGLEDEFKRSLAGLTKGYGGADLRALCTEAALNAVQRTFPQIYSSSQRLKVDLSKIKITAKDFMLSIKKMVPSSERSSSSGASPLPKTVEPLLRQELATLEKLIDDMVPIKKKTTALEEAMYEQPEEDDAGFSRVVLQQEFEKAKVFRPRLLIRGAEGMGQSYLGAALLNHFEGLHVQNFDLPTIYSDSARSPEAVVVQLFTEVKRHKPSVIYIPGIDTWYNTVSDTVISTFVGMLQSIATTDPILVLGITDRDDCPPELEKIFAFSRRSLHTISKPSTAARKEFFTQIVNYTYLAPKDFPEPANRKKRKLEELPPASPLPPPPPHIPTKEEEKAVKKRDHLFLNTLKIALQPVMDQLKKKYRRFLSPVIPKKDYLHVLMEKDPNYVRPDVSQPERQYELDHDKHGAEVLRERDTGNIYYNIDLTIIEERLSNGYYCRPQDFLGDVASVAKDNILMGRKFGDPKEQQRVIQAKEMLANVEVDVDMIERQPQFVDCENVRKRQIERHHKKEKKRKEKEAAAAALARISPVRGDIEGDVQASEMPAPSVIPNLDGTAAPTSNMTPWSTPAHASEGRSNQSSQNLLMSNGSLGSMDVNVSGSTQRPVQPYRPQVPTQWPDMPRNGSTTSTTRPDFMTQSALQSIPQNTSPSQLINDASTTTSGKKTSENQTTSRSSNVSLATNKTFFEYGRGEGDSQLSDTQGSANPDYMMMPATQTQGTGASTDDSWVHSQAHGLRQQGILFQNGPSQNSNSQPNSQPHVPLFHSNNNNPPPRSNRMSPPNVASIANIVNSPLSSEPHLQFSQPASTASSAPSSQKPVLIGDDFGGQLLDMLVDGTNGFSVEMLEQVNRELMVELWKFRGEYNRNLVGVGLIECFEKCVRDMEEVRGLERGALRGY